MRRWIVFGLALLVTLGTSDMAEAKKKKKNRGGDADTVERVDTDQRTDPVAPEEVAEIVELEIVETGIADVDVIFMKANEPLMTLRGAREKVAGVNTHLVQALGLADDTAFSDALADLSAKADGKIMAAIDEQGMPTLEASDAVPENVQTALDAVNAGFAEVNTAVQGLDVIPAQVEEVIAAASAFNPKALIDSGVSPLKAPKIMKTVQGNMQVLGAIKDEPGAITAAMNDMISEVKAAFSPADG